MNAEALIAAPPRYRGAELHPDAAPGLKAEDLPAMWNEVTRLAEASVAAGPRSALREFLDAEPGEEDEANLVGVHHVGVYLGDYRSDADIFAWMDFLDRLCAKGVLREAMHGPSYIAPRQYGTQGWWSSVVTAQGAVIETFSCREFGPWRTRSHVERGRLMSHAAIGVSNRTLVRLALDGFVARQQHLSLIAYTEGDEIGHCYGHLRNEANGLVIELIHAPLGDTHA